MFKKEAKKVTNKNVETNLYLVAHIGSGFNSYVVINNLPQWRSVVKLFRNGPGISSPKLYNGYVDENKNLLKMFNIDVKEFILIVV